MNVSVDELTTMWSYSEERKGEEHFHHYELYPLFFIIKTFRLRHLHCPAKIRKGSENGSLQGEGCERVTNSA